MQLGRRAGLDPDPWRTRVRLDPGQRVTAGQGEGVFPWRAQVSLGSERPWGGSCSEGALCMMGASSEPFQVRTPIHLGPQTPCQPRRRQQRGDTRQKPQARRVRSSPAQRTVGNLEGLPRGAPACADSDRKQRTDCEVGGSTTRTTPRRDCSQECRDALFRGGILKTRVVRLHHLRREATSGSRSRDCPCPVAGGKGFGRLRGR